MPRQYGITQYFATDETLVEAIVRMSPSWERRAIRIHWRGLDVTIENRRGSCPKCKQPLWMEKTDNETCSNCNRSKN